MSRSSGFISLHRGNIEVARILLRTKCCALLFTFAIKITTRMTTMDVTQFGLSESTWESDLLDFDFDFPELENLSDSSISYTTGSPFHDSTSDEASHSSGDLSSSSKLLLIPSRGGLTSGTKERRAVCKTKSSKKVKKITADVFNNNGKAPNMSRRAQGSVLCAFPTFDKCDSLVFFPISMTKHLNSGDFPAVRKLFSTHAHKNCDVSFHGMPAPLSTTNFVRLFEIINEFHPDSVMCVHTTKVVDNTIRSDLFMKFTDNKLIYESAARNIKDPLFADMFAHRRSENWEKKVAKETKKSEEERQRLLAITGSDDDFVVYANLSLVLNFDYMTRKVVKMNYDFELTSLNVA